MTAKTREPVLAGASGDRSPPRAAGSARARATATAANRALYWTVAFIALHVYWYLGGRVGFGDQVDSLPGAPSNLGDWIFSLVVFGMFAAGLAVPSALARPWGQRVPRRLLVWLMWIGCAVLVVRGGLGLLDDGLRFTGLVDGGLTGLTNKDVLGSAHPSIDTMLSTVAIDSIFLAGGLLFGHAARLARDPRARHARRTQADRLAALPAGALAPLKSLSRLRRTVARMGRCLPAISVATAAWGVLFAIVHAYWAAGGSAGMDEPADSVGAQLYIAFIALLGLAGAAVALARVRTVAHRRATMLLARMGGAVLIFGVLLGSVRWIVGDGSPDVGGILITMYFLIGGVLLSALGRGPTARRH
jgi:hypothetical protein